MVSQRLDVDALTPRIALPLANCYLDCFTYIKFCGSHLRSLQECGGLRHSCGTEVRMPCRLCHITYQPVYFPRDITVMLRGQDVLYVVFGILEATMTTPKAILLSEVRTRTGRHCCNSFIR